MASTKPISEAKPVVSGQHIFPEDELHILAVRWKEMNAAGRHAEAMELLEQIIIGSTPMFERLAQHEKFHYTVDLSVLVSAAQEKVVKWLLSWEPKKGRLFTFFCLHGTTPVSLADGTTRTIQDLVEKREPAKVMCWNEETKRFEARAITNWGRSPATRQEWRKLIIKTPTVYCRPIYITKDHPVYTQRGWVPVDELTSTDSLYRNQTLLTEHGKAAIIGMHLGDGTIARYGETVITHCLKQRAYAEHIAKVFAGRSYTVPDGQKSYSNVKGKRVAMHHGGEQKVRIRLLEMWPETSLLWETDRSTPKKKEVTNWVIKRISPVSLAYWHMDDGSYCTTNNALTLATCGFTKNECEKLAVALRVKFGIIATLNKHSINRYILSVKARSRDAYYRLIAPYIIPEMNYKMPEAYRGIPKIELAYTVDVLTEIPPSGYSVQRYFDLTKRNKLIPCSSFEWKYDISVDGISNFFAGRRKLLVHNSKCSRHAFLSEIVRVNQFRKRYHSTDDNLEKFLGTEDHTIEKKDIAKEMRAKLDKLTCRWGDPQEIGSLRFLIECIMDDDDRDKHAAIRTVSYAWGISPEMARFFYAWALMALRIEFSERIRVPLTEQDLWRLKESYSQMPDLLDFLPWEKVKEFIVRFGGTRFKVPTIAALVRLKEDQAIFEEIEAGDKDPDSIAEVALRHKKTPRGASEIYEEMSRINDPNRSGEHYIYDQHDNNEHS